jgi:cell division protease FtsH
MKKQRDDRLGIDSGRPAPRTASIAPERLGVPASAITVGELRDAFGQGLPVLTDEVKKFLGVEPDQVACVTSTFHIIYHPIVCMALAAEGLLANYEIRLTNFNYQHTCAPKYVNVPLSCRDSMKCLAEGVMFLRTPGGIRFVVRIYIDSYAGVVCLETHVPADRAQIADHFFSGLATFVHQNNIFRGQRITPDGGFVDVAHYTWDDLILAEEQKLSIRRNIIDMIARQSLYERNGVATKRGIMFYGPPGTGKTLTGKVLASQMQGVTFVWVTPNHIKGASSVVGIYGLARELAPTIVFIEDVDLIAKDRSLDGENPVLCELMNQLDGIKENRGVITIVTTNYPGIVEGALQNRPGRFDRRIEFSLPDAAVRERMLASMLDGRVLDRDARPIDLRAVAALCDGMSPSHLREVVNTAVMNAIDRGSLTATDLAVIDNDHLTDAAMEVLANGKAADPRPGAVSDIVQRDYGGKQPVDAMTPPTVQSGPAPGPSVIAL